MKVKALAVSNDTTKRGDNIIMNDSSPSPPLPPSSVCWSIDNNDEGSELTGSPLYDEQHSKGPGPAHSMGIKGGEEPDCFSPVQLAAAADPDKQEILELKLQISQQQEKLNSLSSKLSRSDVENEAMKAEKKVLVDELSHLANNQQQQQRDSQRGWVSNSGIGPASMQYAEHQHHENASGGGGGDDARSLAVMRKSFQNYIKLSRKDKQTIGNLQRENEMLRQQLNAHRNNHHGKLSASERTAQTYPLDPDSIFTSSVSTMQQDSMFRNSQLTHISQVSTLHESSLRNSLNASSHRSHQDGSVMFRNSQLSQQDTIMLRKSLSSLPEQEFSISSSSERRGRRHSNESMYRPPEQAFGSSSSRRNHTTMNQLRNSGISIDRNSGLIIDRNSGLCIDGSVHSRGTSTAAVASPPAARDRSQSTSTSTDLLVNFGEGERSNRRLPATYRPARRWHSHTEGAAARPRRTIVDVDFGETAATTTVNHNRDDELSSGGRASDDNNNTTTGRSQHSHSTPEGGVDVDFGEITATYSEEAESRGSAADINTTTTTSGRRRHSTPEGVDGNINMSGEELLVGFEEQTSGRLMGRRRDSSNW